MGGNLCPHGGYRGWEFGYPIYQENKMSQIILFTMGGNSCTHGDIGEVEGVQIYQEDKMYQVIISTLNTVTGTGVAQ